MELKIGARIRSLRRAKNLTQEEVASHLGISFQAISKWERGEGYPDITLLPALASYFSVSADELLGMDEIAAEEIYRKINEEWEQDNRKGRHQENVDRMKEALKRFPNDALLLVQLSTSLEKLPGSEQERREYLRQSIAVQEQILRYGEDSEVRSATMYNICHAYLRNGERDKAVRQAMKLGNFYKTRENALTYLLEGEERAQAAREGLEALRWSVQRQLSALGRADMAEKILEMMNEL